MIYEIKTYRWYTTPATLRYIADEMEERWKAAILGDENIAYRKSNGRDKILEVCFPSEQYTSDRDKLDKGTL